MKRRSIVVAMLLGAWPLHRRRPGRAPGGPGRRQAAPQADVPTFSVGTAAVTLRRRRAGQEGNAVRDLKASDFEVFEDGVKQKVESFKVYGTSAPAPGCRRRPRRPRRRPRPRRPAVAPPPLRRTRRRDSPRSSPSSSTGCPPKAGTWPRRRQSPTWTGATWMAIWWAYSRSTWPSGRSSPSRRDQPHPARPRTGGVAGEHPVRQRSWRDA